jgi:hypothetical protein
MTSPKIAPQRGSVDRPQARYQMRMQEVVIAQVIVRNRSSSRLPNCGPSYRSARGRLTSQARCATRPTTASTLRSRRSGAPSW